MAASCITEAARDKASADCKKYGPFSVTGAAACARARKRLCPPPDVQPIIEQGKDGINLLGVYVLCKPQPTELAPYPPSRPFPNEAAAQAALQRLSTQVKQQSSEMRALEFRASRARKITLTAGFWVGLGLVALGGGALYYQRR